MHDQHTLRETLEFDGVGLHTGIASRVRVLPQAAGSGIRFRLVDAGVAFAALPECVVETRRATVVGSSGVTVSTVEHLLSALFGMGARAFSRVRSHAAASSLSTSRARSSSSIGR